jgi:hypothetical protein
MAPKPLICPRCGKEQRVVPGDPRRAVKVVHADTGREDCTAATGTPAPAAPDR